MIPKKLPWATGWVTVLLNKMGNILGSSEETDDLYFGQNEFRMPMGYPRENILAGSGILGVEPRKWV